MEAISEEVAVEVSVAPGEESASPLLTPSYLRRGLMAGSGYFFLFFMGIASYVTFINVYFLELGFSGFQIGLVAALGAVITIVTTPLWMAIADRWQIHRLILTALSFITGLLFLLMLGLTSFIPILFVILAIEIFWTPPVGLVDSAMVGLTQRSGKSYPRVRVWGSVGFGVGSLIMAWLVGRWGNDSIFWLQFICFSIGLTVLGLLIPEEKNSHKVEYVKSLKALLGLKHYRGFLAFMLGYGILNSANLSFAGPFITSLGGTLTLVGLTFAISTALEIPAMLSGDYWARRFGQRRTILITGIGMMVVVAITSQAQQPIQVLVVLSLLGLFSGVLWSVIAPYAIGNAPYAVRASAMGIVMAVFTGIGFAVGNYVSGYIWDYAGGMGTYLFGALAMGLGVGYFWWSTREPA